jgi:hypothetical protein
MLRASSRCGANSRNYLGLEYLCGEKANSSDPSPYVECRNERIAESPCRRTEPLHLHPNPTKIINVFEGIRQVDGITVPSNSFNIFKCAPAGKVRQEPCGENDGRRKSGYQTQGAVDVHPRHRVPESLARPVQRCVSNVLGELAWQGLECNP